MINIPKHLLGGRKVITNKEENLAVALRRFHDLMKLRLMLNKEISKAKEEVLFYESLQEIKTKCKL